MKASWIADDEKYAERIAYNVQPNLIIAEGPLPLLKRT